MTHTDTEKAQYVIPSPQSAVAQVRAYLIATYKLRARTSHPEELERGRCPHLGVAVSWASGSVWVRPMAGRAWIRTGAVQPVDWSRGGEAWRYRIDEIIGDHFEAQVPE